MCNCLFEYAKIETEKSEEANYTALIELNSGIGYMYARLGELHGVVSRTLKCPFCGAEYKEE